MKSPSDQFLEDVERTCHVPMGADRQASGRRALFTAGERHGIERVLERLRISASSVSAPYARGLAEAVSLVESSLRAPGETAKEQAETMHGPLRKGEAFKRMVAAAGPLETTLLAGSPGGHEQNSSLVQGKPVEDKRGLTPIGCEEKQATPPGTLLGTSSGNGAKSHLDPGNVPASSTLDQGSYSEPSRGGDDVIAQVDNRRLANYIVQFLRSRNSGELDEAIAALTVESYELLHDELEEIIKHRGRPPNWTTP